MGVNKNKKHLVVIQEDSPYRELLNGVRNSPHVDGYKIDNRAPAGGWSKVFCALEDNHALLERYSEMHLLLLMDFDRKFGERMQHFKEMIADKSYQSRVFLLGVDNKEFENLKQTLKKSNVEKIGQELVKGCPDQQSAIWDTQQLACNQTEIDRMRKAGVFKWLFT